MTPELQSILEEHGFNSDILLFGSANKHPLQWISLNRDLIGGSVSKIHFSAPPFSGNVALIAAETPFNNTLMFPEDQFFISIDQRKEKHHILSMLRDISQASNVFGHIEASFVGSGYHIDCVRGNFATGLEGKQIRYQSSNTEANRLSDSPETDIKNQRMNSKIQSAKFGLTITGADGLVISKSESNRVIVAHYGRLAAHPASLHFSERGLQLVDTNRQQIILVNSQELQDKIKVPLADNNVFIVYDKTGILEWHRLDNITD